MSAYWPDTAEWKWRVEPWRPITKCGWKAFGFWRKTRNCGRPCAASPSSATFAWHLAARKFRTAVLVSSARPNGARNIPNRIGPLACWREGDRSCSRVPRISRKSQEFTVIGVTGEGFALCGHAGGDKGSALDRQQHHDEVDWGDGPGCGGCDCEDKFDWESLPPHYLRQINHPKARTR